MTIEGQVLKSLCNTYSGRLPRYTSYPTAVEFKPVEDVDPVLEALKNAATTHHDISLYVHVPHCPSLCYFCACNKVISQNPKDRDRYVDVLSQELRLLHSKLTLNSKIVQVHLGGGSPSYLSIEQLVKLEDAISAELPLAHDVERSIELDPRTYTREQGELLFKRGYRRASLGVQDFDPVVQEIINRRQPYELTRDVYGSLREIGFSGINFDLIYGLPGQTRDSVSRTIESVIELHPDRIALYGYAHVTWKVKSQNVFNKHPLPSPDQRIELLVDSTEKLLTAGYIYIGMDHFALPSDSLAKALTARKLRRNFMGYTTICGELMLGVGPSAISDIDACLFQNERELEKYYSQISQGRLPVQHVIWRGEEDKLRAHIIEGLLCNGTIDENEVRSNFASQQFLAESIFKLARERLAPMVRDKLVEFEASCINATNLGRYFLRNIAGTFDQYLDEHGQTEKRFSQAI